MRKEENSKRLKHLVFKIKKNSEIELDEGKKNKNKNIKK
jgi:hypothetical protein